MKQPFGHSNPKLVIYISDDTSRLGEGLLAWNLMRLRLNLKEVQVRYKSNWYSGHSEVLLILGKDICKDTIKVSHSQYLYSRLPAFPIWIGHSIDYALMKPSETYKINRMLYLAAEEAGLEPKSDLELEVYKHYVIK